MNWRRVWVVARKDLAEVRTSRWMIASIIAAPMLIAIVVPYAVIAPLAYSGATLSTEPLPISPHPTVTTRNQVLLDTTLTDDSIDHCRITNATIIDSIISNTSLTRVYVVGSVLHNVTLSQSVVRGSNLYNSTFGGASVLLSSVVVGQENPVQLLLARLVDYLLFVFVLIPAVVPTTMASYTIIGEKTNRSLEPLLASPVSESELLVGKATAILLPSLGATWAAFVVFLVIISTQFATFLAHSPVTNPAWFLAVFLLAPVICLLSIAANILVSSRVSDVRVAQQLGVLVVLPVMVYFIASLAGVLSVTPDSILILVGLIGAVTIAVFYGAVRVFNREEILVRWK